MIELFFTLLEIVFVAWIFRATDKILIDDLKKLRESRELLQRSDDLLKNTGR